MPAVEVLLVSGASVVVEGTTETVEAAVLSAARGSIMQLAWLTERDGGGRVGVNPDHVVALRELGATDAGDG